MAALSVSLPQTIIPLGLLNLTTLHCLPIRTTRHNRRQHARAQRWLRPAHPATPREREVLLFIAEGPSNAEIAGRPYLSEATTKPACISSRLSVVVRE